MAKVKRTTIQCARCRRAGEKLFLKGEKCVLAKCPLTRRSYPPGMHGQSSRSRSTGYGNQLREKQKAKWIYGLREAQFSKYAGEAASKKGDTAHNLLQTLERRLDNVIYRLGAAKSRRAARQLVSHAHFLVNQKKVNIPSYRVKPNDTISFRDQFDFSSIKQEPPVWLSWNMESRTAKVLGLPKPEDIQTNFDLKKIIEFYSR